MKKLSRKKIIILLLCFLVIGVSAFLFKNKFLPEKKVHYHAGFVVFQNNKKISFSDFKYMYEKPCTLKGKDDESDENNQLEKAHLHDNVGDVIHIERDGAHWKDLFTNIHYPIKYSSARGFINGKEVKNFQSQAINPEDSLTVFIGNNDIKQKLAQAPTKNYIDQMGKRSKTCGD